jgi:hypothetical protein
MKVALSIIKEMVEVKAFMVMVLYMKDSGKMILRMV